MRLALLGSIIGGSLAACTDCERECALKMCFRKESRLKGLNLPLLFDFFVFLTFQFCPYLCFLHPFLSF